MKKKHLLFFGIICTLLTPVFGQSKLCSETGTCPSILSCEKYVKDIEGDDIPPYGLHQVLIELKEVPRIIPDLNSGDFGYAGISSISHEIGVNKGEFIFDNWYKLEYTNDFDPKCVSDAFYAYTNEIEHAEPNYISVEPATAIDESSNEAKTIGGDDEINHAKSQLKNLASKNTQTTSVQETTRAASVNFNDTYYVDQWYLNSFKNNTSYNYASSILMDQAWTITKGHSGVKIGIIDYGFQIDTGTTDVDLETNLINMNMNDEIFEEQGYSFNACNNLDFTSGSLRLLYNASILHKNFINKSISSCTHGHSMLTSISAIQNNEMGLAGIINSTNIQLFPAYELASLNEINTRPWPNNSPEYNAAQNYLFPVGFDSALMNYLQKTITYQNSTDNKIDVFTSSLSLSNPLFDSISYITFLRKRFSHFVLENYNSLFVYPSGNVGQDDNIELINLLSNNENVMFVGCSNNTDTQTNEYCVYSEKMSIVSPGIQITSDDGKSFPETIYKNRYNRLKGSSYSTAITSAVAGLVYSLAKEHNKPLSGSMTRKLLETTTDKYMFSPNHKTSEGLQDKFQKYTSLRDDNIDVNGKLYGMARGRLNAHQALLIADAYTFQNPSRIYTPQQTGLERKAMGRNLVMFNNNQTHGLALNRHKMSAYKLPKDGYEDHTTAWDLEHMSPDQITNLPITNQSSSFQEYYANELVLEGETFKLTHSVNDPNHTWEVLVPFKKIDQLQGLNMDQVELARCGPNLFKTISCAFGRSKERSEKKMRKDSWFELDYDGDLVVKRRYEYEGESHLSIDWAVTTAKEGNVVNQNNRNLEDMINTMIAKDFTYTIEDQLATDDPLEENDFFTTNNQNYRLMHHWGKIALLNDSEGDNYWEEAFNLFDSGNVYIEGGENKNYEYNLHFAENGDLIYRRWEEDDYGQKITESEDFFAIYPNCIYTANNKFTFDIDPVNRNLKVLGDLGSNKANPIYEFNLDAGDPVRGIFVQTPKCVFPKEGQHLLVANQKLTNYNQKPIDGEVTYLLDKEKNTITIKDGNMIKVIHRDNFNGDFSTSPTIHTYTLN